MRVTHRPLSSLLCLAVLPAAALPGATLIKADNSDPLASPSSWTGDIVPGPADIALFDSTLTAPLATTLGSDLALSGLQLTNPAGDVALEKDGHALTLGADGLTMSAATQVLALNCDLLVGGSIETWNIAGRVTVNGNILQTGSRWNQAGAGTLTLAGRNDLSNLSTLDLQQGTLKVAGSAALNGFATDMHLDSIGSTFDLAGGNAFLHHIDGSAGTITNSSPNPATLTLSGPVKSDITPLPFIGSITDGAGGVSLVADNFSSIRLGAPCSFTGSVTLRDNGGMSVDSSYATTANFLSPILRITLNGGFLGQRARNAPASQTYAGITLEPGGSTISQSYTAPNYMSIGTIQRTGPGATVRFSPIANGTSGIYTSTPVAADGLLGSWAVLNGTDWATRDTAGASTPVHALAAAQYSTAFAPGMHTSLSASGTAPLDGSTESLRITGTAVTLLLNGSDAITSGGILISSTASGTLIAPSQPTDTLTSGNGSELIVHTYSNATISGVISDAGAASINLTIAGTSILTLAATNTYTGTTFADGGTLTFAASNPWLHDVTGNGNITVNAGVSVVSDVVRLYGLTVNGSYTIRPGTGTASRLRDLSIASSAGVPTAILDISDAPLIYQHGGANAPTLSAIQALVSYGSANPAGITSSTTAADPAHKFTVVVDNAVLGLTQFAGQLVDANALLIESTYKGDSNLDRKVDVIDLGVLATNYGTSTAAGITKGDYNNDGKVDVIDLGILATDYGLGTGPGGFSLQQQLLAFPQLSPQSSELSPAPVPEPGSLALLALAAPLLLRRRAGRRGMRIKHSRILEFPIQLVRDRHW